MGAICVKTVIDGESDASKFKLGETKWWVYRIVCGCHLCHIASNVGWFDFFWVYISFDC